MAILSVMLEPEVRLHVFDSHNKTVADQFGAYEAALPLGRYVIEIERAGLMQRQSVWLTPEPGRVVLTQADFDLTYRSAAPLANVRKGLKEPSSPDDIAAQNSVNQTPVMLGDGAEIFLFVRAADVASRTNPARGIQLLSLDGDVVADLDALEEHVAVAPKMSWASVRLSVDPGNYLLRTHSGMRRHDRTITAGPGFQTQVFLTYEQTDPTHWGIAPGVASVLAAPIGAGFAPSNPHAQIADLMLQALLSGDFELDRSVVSRAMNEKIGDPMLGVYLGIYLANSLTRDREFQKSGDERAMSPDTRDRALFQIELILLNVMPGFRPNADLTILDAWFRQFRGGSSPDPVFIDASPMLAASWPLARQVELSRPDFIAPDSLAYKAALVPMPAGPWFTWRPLAAHQLDLGLAPKGVSDEVAASFVDALRNLEQRPRVEAGSFAEIEALHISPDESLSDVFARVSGLEKSEADRPLPPAEDASEFALSRFVLVAPEDQTGPEREGRIALGHVELPTEDRRLKDFLIQDKFTGAVITPEEGVASLRIQLGRSLAHVADGLNNIKMK